MTLYEWLFLSWVAFLVTVLIVICVWHPLAWLLRKLYTLVKYKSTSHL